MRDQRVLSVGDSIPWDPAPRYLVRPVLARLPSNSIRVWTGESDAIFLHSARLASRIWPEGIVSSRRSEDGDLHSDVGTVTDRKTRRRLKAMVP